MTALLFFIACRAPSPTPPQPACDDGQLSGTETDVDCGGTCSPCNNGNACGAASDCESGLCLSSVCAAVSCGDGVVSNGEACDTGSASASCDADCTAPACGDGVFNAAAEECDDGNAVPFDGCENRCAPTTLATFSFTGDAQAFVVPPGVTLIHVIAQGAQGGCALGGLGGSAEADVPVVPGETLSIFVGGQGQCGTTGSLSGGFNGGGAKFATNDNYTGGSGGGASDVRRAPDGLTDRLIVAGGGGGQGYGGQAGAGGGVDGLAGDPTNGGCGASTCAGQGGTQSAGGTGGVCNASCIGLDGQLGVGGRGTACIASGGGGGGGYYGGGGGGHCSAGGGSSRADLPGNTQASTTAGVRSGDGEVQIQY